MSRDLGVCALKLAVRVVLCGLLSVLCVHAQFVAAPQPAIPAALLSNLTSFWNLEEATGASRADSKGTNTLTSNNGVTQVAGKISNGAGFNGTTQYLSIASNASVRATGSISVACWVKPTTSSAQEIIGQWLNTAGAGNRSYVLQLLSGNAVTFGIRNAADSATVSKSAAITTGAWSFVAGVYDASGQTVGISVNGASTATAVATTGIQTATAAFAIGAFPNPSLFLNASLDACGLWNGYALTQADISYLYAAGRGLQWPLASGQAVAYPTGHPFQPSDVANYQIELAGDARGGLPNFYTDTGCTSRVSAAGDAIGCWKDLGPAACHATQATASARPTYQIVNGRAVARFDGVDDNLNLSCLSLFNAASGGSIFAVWAPGVGACTGTRSVVSFSSGTSAVASRIALECQATMAARVSTRRLDAEGDSVSGSANNILAASTRVLQTGLTDLVAGTNTGYVNGVRVSGPSALISAGATFSATNSLAAHVGLLNTLFMPEDIFTIRVFNATVSDANRRSIEHYLCSGTYGYALSCQ